MLPHWISSFQELHDFQLEDICMQGGSLPLGFPNSGSAAAPAPNASSNAKGMTQTMSYANRLLVLSLSPQHLYNVAG